MSSNRCPNHAIVWRINHRSSYSYSQLTYGTSNARRPRANPTKGNGPTSFTMSPTMRSFLRSQTRCRSKTSPQFMVEATAHSSNTLTPCHASTPGTDSNPPRHTPPPPPPSLTRMLDRKLSTQGICPSRHHMCSTRLLLASVRPHAASRG